MARSLEARLATLEAPQGGQARSYAMLKACYEILCRLDDAPMPDDAELLAMARQEIGPNYTAAIQDVWASQP